METVGKQTKKKKKGTRGEKNTLITHRNSQNKPDRKLGIGCVGWVTLDRVRTTDEWVQGAVMCDISHQTSQSDKKCHSRDKRTRVVCRLQTRSVTEESVVGTLEQ